MTEDRDNNPFNGVDQGPTNEELLRNWRNGLLFSTIIFPWLIAQSLLGYTWADFLLEQGVVLWSCLAAVTWWRAITHNVLTFFIALLAGWRAFIAVWRE